MDRATTRIAATPAKLSDGTWGAKVTGDVKAGDTITIATLGGTSWDAKVDRVLWSDGTASVCSTKFVGRSSSPRPSRRSSTCSVFGCQSPATVAGMCAPCDFDENDM